MRYAAIGDSFTEGLGDGDDSTPRGWADLVAAGLAADGPVRYANLAVRGRLLESIVTQQLDQALALSPTLLTLNGGGNDMMRPGGNAARLARLTEQAIRRCAGTGVRLVLISTADPSDRLPLGGVIRRRASQLTAAVAELAVRHRVDFVDVFADTELRRDGYWSPDRLHLGPAGHRRVAALVLTALGYAASAPPLVAAPPAPHRLRDEARYYAEHVVPWLGRSLTGRSTGRTRAGRHSTWITVGRP
jgi:lysophospholipase L1-like esterase